MDATSERSHTPLLHWSFDHGVASKPAHFGDELIRILRDYWADPSGAAEFGATAVGERTVVRYQVLPNYRIGDRYRDGSVLPVASLAIASTAGTDGTGAHEVSYENTASGERLDARFETTNDAMQTVTGSFQLEVENRAPDAYRCFSVEGRVRQHDAHAGGAIELTANGLALAAREWRGAPLVTPWTIPAVLPRIETQVEVAVLEDLEQLREPARIVPLDGWAWPAPNQDLPPLQGWCLHGSGLLPLYYWVDPDDVAVIVSGLYATWVVTRKDSDPHISPG